MKSEHLRRVGAWLLTLALVLPLLMVPAAAEESERVAVTGVTLDKTEMTLIVGNAGALTASVMPEEASDKTVNWSSDKPAVATVSGGMVNAVSAGTAVITATTADGGKTASCKVTSVVAADVEIGPAERVMEVEDSVVLNAQTADHTLKWNLDSGEGVVSITAATDGSCTVEALAPGRAVVSATSANGTSDSCIIEVSGIVLEKTSLTLFEGRTESLSFATYGNAPSTSSVVWESNNISVAEIVNGKITTYNPGRAQITAKAGKYKATCALTVEEDVADAIERSMNAGLSYAFSNLMDDLNDRCIDKTGADLRSINSLSVSTEQGILYYGYVSPDAPGLGVGTETYYVSPGNGQRALDDITFVPRTDYTGTATIRYSGRGTNNQNFKGTISISVKSTGDVSYSTASGRPLVFESDDFTAICKAKTGREISYITFEQPSSNQGVLYYNYTAGQYSQEVSNTTKYYRTNNPYLDKISFVPTEDYTGTVKIPYKCTTAGGTHSGTVTITVYRPSGTEEDGLEYSVSKGSYVTFDASDFNDLCLDELDATLRYVYFELPDADKGTLYYNYRSAGSYAGLVSESTRYFRSSTTPRISYVSFVPEEDFTGTVTIPFTGYDTYGESFEANVIVRVGSGSSTVTYSTGSGQAVDFNGYDFNEACMACNGETLDWVKFDVPATSVGTLFRNYRSSNSTGTKIKDSTRLYFNGGTEISDVTFVPKNTFSGTAIIPFSGYDVDDGEFSGRVEIRVGGTAGEKTIQYSVVGGSFVNFSAEDFNMACQLITGDNLNYLRFSLPSAEHGELYYQYNANKGSGSSVYASTNYYRSSSRYLDEVSFVANSSFNGLATIHYTGWSTAGERFTGNVEIEVSSSRSTGIRYYGSSLPITLRAQDFQSACSAMLGRTLSYVEFNMLPSASAGRFYVNYSSPAEKGTEVTAGTSYYVNGMTSIGQISFVPRAEYEGQVAVGYTGWDISGTSYQGTLTIYLSNSYCSSLFQDMSAHRNAIPSVEFLRQYGIVNGYSDTSFGPGGPISRGAFALMICRAFKFNVGGTAGFPDVPANSVYADAVATAKALKIVEGNNGLFYPTSSITRQSAMAMMCRAMEAAGKTIPPAPDSILSAYADGDQVASHARAAVAALLQMGAVSPDSSGRLNPTVAMTRAEMAVILHHILTV